MESIYHLTAQGRAARELPGSALPQVYRELLGCVGRATLFGELAAQLERYGEAELRARLEDLEAIGLVESVPALWVAALFEL